MIVFILTSFSKRYSVYSFSLPSISSSLLSSPLTTTTTTTTATTIKRCFRSSTPSGLNAAAKGGGRVSNAVVDKDVLSKTDKGKSNKKKEKLDTNPVKGTRDFYPEDMRLRSWLFGKWKETASGFAFSEYDAPVLESKSLYTRKAGEEVTQQLYNFVDKGDREVSLRPEMTPSLARMVMAKGGKGGLTMPLKWFSIPQCWRYERMTRGRRREHFQWNMDIWGVEGVEAEAELLSAMVSFFESIGLSGKDVGIKVSSRLLIGELLEKLGVPEEKFAATCVLVDKLEKVPLDAIQGDLEELGLDRSVVETLTDLMEKKSLDAMRPVLGEDSEALVELERLFQLCEVYGIQDDWIVFDASVVRGLAYYTGVVFEAFDRKGELRAIAGGGRYDKLLETFGGDPTPACGFGFGDAVVVELLKERSILPSFESSGFDAVVFALTPELYNEALAVAGKLRQAGQSVDVVLEKKKPKWVFKHANRLNVKYCVIVAPDEFENGEVSVKDMTTGKQRSVKIDQIADELVS